MSYDVYTGSVPLGVCRQLTFISCRHAIGMLDARKCYAVHHKLIANIEECGKTYGVNTESDPSRPVTPSCVIRQNDGYEKLRDVVTHCDETCMMRRSARVFSRSYIHDKILDPFDPAI